MLDESPRNNMVHKRPNALFFKAPLNSTPLSVNNKILKTVVKVAESPSSTPVAKKKEFLSPMSTPSNKINRQLYNKSKTSPCSTVGRSISVESCLNRADFKSPLSTPRSNASNLRKAQSGSDLSSQSSSPRSVPKTPKSTPTVARDAPSPSEECSYLSVAVRIRPLNSKEKTVPDISQIFHTDGRTLKVQSNTGVTTFNYDYCFNSEGENGKQEDVFDKLVEPLLSDILKGYNSCLFAYGQTGSGKSYSMMGPPEKISDVLNEDNGIIPRFCHELFEKIALLKDNAEDAQLQYTTTHKVEVNYFEIYNEKIHDLLVKRPKSYGADSSCVRGDPLRVREHPVHGPYVVGLTMPLVNSYEDLEYWLTLGNDQRAISSNGLNDKSSRSHTIFSVIYTNTTVFEADGSRDISRCSKIHLVDLAGSERIVLMSPSTDRIREGASINRSLLTLRKVMSALYENSSNKRKVCIPYRESVLTWLLKESLGGNSRTTMLATVSPANIHLEESLSTLRYALQARAIMNTVKINEDPNEIIIRELTNQIEKLQGELRQMQVNDALTNSSQKREPVLREFKKGCALFCEWTPFNDLPCLMVVKPSLAVGFPLMHLVATDSCLVVGRPSINSVPDIPLEGPNVRINHCIIRNENNVLALVMTSDGETRVNGHLVENEQSVVLFHEDRVQIGGKHQFLVHIPNSALPQTITYSYQNISINMADNSVTSPPRSNSYRRYIKNCRDTAENNAAELEMENLELMKLNESLTEEVKMKLQTISDLDSSLSSEDYPEYVPNQALSEFNDTISKDEDGTLTVHQMDNLFKRKLFPLMERPNGRWTENDGIFKESRKISKTSELNISINGFSETPTESYYTALGSLRSSSEFQPGIANEVHRLHRTLGRLKDMCLNSGRSKEYSIVSDLCSSAQLLSAEDDKENCYANRLLASPKKSSIKSPTSAPCSPKSVTFDINDSQ